MTKNITDCLIALLTAFAVCSIMAPVIIPLLRKLKVGQTERVEGVQAHLAKAGTPTMGGIVFLAAFLVSSAFFIGRYPRIVPVLFLTLGFGIIGFLDDYLKVVMHRSDGLYPKQKMLGQIIVTTVFVVYLWVIDSSLLELMIPFTGGKLLSGMAVKIIATPLAYFAIIGTVNGVNFTDGLDGLAASVTSIVAVFFLITSLRLGAGIDPAPAAMLGALMGFLMFNVKPAMVFMGDTGSLALGGFVAGCAYMMRMPIFIIIIGLVYLVEVLSVIIQVTYFKKTGGKRFFRMAPIHHHFELMGWSEPRVDAVFTIVTVLLCMIAYVGM
jgi:phospho-N-acetylmuramoyl-pentapeptide-transferase